MSLPLQGTVFSQTDLTITGVWPMLTYDLIMDALSNASSTLTMEKTSAVNAGDYIAIRKVNDANILYFGQISTVDVDNTTSIMTLTTNYIWNVINGDALVSTRSGDSYEQHIINLIRRYAGANSPIVRDLGNTTNTAYSVTSSDGLTVTNMLDYIQRGFKLHNTVLDVVGIGQGTTPKGVPFYWPKINVHQVTDTWNFKNDVYDFYNWIVTDSRGLRGYANELWIVDKGATTDIENPHIMSRYYLKKDGSVTQTLTDEVAQPTQVKVYLYDTTATDNPSYDSIAQSNLSNPYSHIISFSTPLTNNFLPLSKVTLGLQSNIFYNDTQYKSVLSSWELSSDSEDIKLTFGNLRFGKNDLYSNSGA